MKNPRHASGHNRHERTLISAAGYWLSKMAFHIAPEHLTRLMREKGFAVKPYRLSDKQRELMRQAQSSFLEFDRNKIKVFEWGSGPVILLVHGWGGRALQLDAFVPALLQRGFKVVAFDHKGHGESATRFSSYLEIVRSTDLLVAHYAQDLYGVVAHSIGSNATFKTSENFERKLKIAAVAPMENFPQWLEIMRRKIGIYEKLYANVIGQIELDTGLNLLEQCQLNFEQIGRHDVLLVHDKFDRINKISASLEIQRNLPASTLVQTEMLGHSRILDNEEVVQRVVAHFDQEKF
jgi:hypothetical protein